MSPLRRALAGLLLLGAPLAAQEKPAEPAERPALGFLGQLLLRSRDAGSLDRLEGERWFRLQSKQGGDAVIMVRVQTTADPPRLVLETTLTTLAQPVRNEMHTQVLMGADGRIQAFRSALRTGGAAESRAQGRVTGAALELEVQEPGRPPRAEQKPWNPEAVPGLALMFVVPALWDALPGDATEVVQFDESAARLAHRVVLRAHSDPGAQGPELVTVTLVDAADRRSVQLEARVDPQGKIVELKREGSVIRALAAEEAQRLLAAERAREAQGPQGQPGPR